MIHHGQTGQFIEPFECGGIGAFTSEEDRAQLCHVASCEQCALWIGLLDRSDRGRRGEESAHAVLFDQLPEYARIGRAHGLAFENHRRIAIEQGSIANIAMPNDPADIARGPKCLARWAIIQTRHRPLQSGEMPTRVAHDPLGLARRA